LGKDFKRQNNGRQNDFKIIILSSIPGLRQGRHFVFLGCGSSALGSMNLDLFYNSITILWAILKYAKNLHSRVAFSFNVRLAVSAG
jgi:hypothetical protein